MFSTVYVFMYFQIKLITKWFITHKTVMWTVSTTYLLICLQMTASIKWFITLITGIWTLSRTCVCWCSFRVSYDKTIYYTHPRNMVPLHCVCALMFLQIIQRSEWFITYTPQGNGCPSNCISWYSFRGICERKDKYIWINITTTTRVWKQEVMSVHYIIRIVCFTKYQYITKI